MHVCVCLKVWTQYDGSLDDRIRCAIMELHGQMRAGETAVLGAQAQSHSGWCTKTLTNSKNADTCSQQHGATAWVWSQYGSAVCSDPSISQTNNHHKMFHCNLIITSYKTIIRISLFKKSLHCQVWTLETCGRHFRVLLRKHIISKLICFSFYVDQSFSHHLILLEGLHVPMILVVQLSGVLCRW